MITIVILLTIIATVAVFSIQNATPVAITFLLWRFEASIAIIVFLSILAGIVITAIIAFSARIKQYIKRRN